MMKKGEINFGDIVWTEFDPSVGHEYQNKRPAVVVQSNQQLAKSNLVTIIPLTSKTENFSPDDIFVAAGFGNNLLMNSVAKVYCITSFDYNRFEKKIGRINEEVSIKIKKYFKKHFDLQEDK